MKNLISVVGLILLSPMVNASCDSDNIIYQNETNFGLSFGKKGTSTNFGETQSINVPLYMNGQSGCYKKTSSFNLKASDSKDKSKGKITISPLEVEFENIPDPSTKQYIFVEKNIDKLQTKFHTLSFICSGELPLSIESTNDSYQKIIVKNVEISYNHVFATGAAAKNLSVARKSYSQDTFNFFLNLYQRKTGKVLGASSFAQGIPDIISETSLHSMTNVDRQITSSFATNGGSAPNGCSKAFSDSMNQYLLENYGLNESLNDYDISEKFFSNDLVFEWKN